MSSPAQTSLTSIRRRRLTIFTTILVGFLFFFGVPWELPAALKDAGVSALSRANIVQFAKSKPNSNLNVAEIYGLLHLVTAEADDENFLSDATDLDPTLPINMSVYADGDERLDWEKTVKKLDKHYPIVIFSKSYCPYSQRAKKLLETYNIHPPPKVIEVDLREDSDIIKAILTRLTGHSTFPNIIIRGQSIGGSDDLQALHAQRALTKVLEQAGATARDDGSGK